MNPTITGHEFGAAGEQLRIEATDEVGHGGAHHVYVVTSQDEPNKGEKLGEINFQNGPVPSHGVNGLSEGALLAIVADRFRGFQSGPFSSRETALALTKVEEALHWIKARTENRVARGVEGKLAK